jgi:hypothetical protein
MTYRVTFKLERAEHWRRYTVEAANAGEAAQLAHARLTAEIPVRAEYRRWHITHVDPVLPCLARSAAG